MPQTWPIFVSGTAKSAYVNDALNPVYTSNTVECYKV